MSEPVDEGGGDEAGELLPPEEGELAGALLPEDAAGLLLAGDAAGVDEEGLLPELEGALGELPLFFLFFLFFFFSFGLSLAFSSSELDLGFTCFSLRAGLEVLLGVAAPLVGRVFEGAAEGEAADGLVADLPEGLTGALPVGLVNGPAAADLVEVVAAFAPDPPALGAAPPRTFGLAEANTKSPIHIDINAKIICLFIVALFNF